MDILFGTPVDPELSTMQATLSSTNSGTGSKSGITPLTLGGQTKIAFLFDATSIISCRAFTVSLAGTTTSGLGIFC
jgi:hypothetical protein